jgi:hypothetical protein
MDVEELGLEKNVKIFCVGFLSSFLFNIDVIALWCIVRNVVRKMRRTQSFVVNAAPL